MAKDSNASSQQAPADDANGTQESGVPANEAGNKEKAEGSRETVTGGGISNRPTREEQENQQRVPPRGESKEGGHA
jgi:hypothetical protein